MMPPGAKPACGVVVGRRTAAGTGIRTVGAGDGYQVCPMARISTSLTATSRFRVTM